VGSIAELSTQQLMREGWEALPLRRILLEGGILLAFVVSSSSWLVWR
jgi:hypothetical protein